MKQRTEGHTETTHFAATRVPTGRDAFELVPSLEVALRLARSRSHVGGARSGLLRIGFVHHQQIIWDKTRGCR